MIAYKYTHPKSIFHLGMSVAEQAAQIMVYGSSFNVPSIGFGIKSYSQILQTLGTLETNTRKNTLGILPNGVCRESWKLFNRLQTHRFAMKRLLLLWNTYRFRKPQWEGNHEDLIGEPIDTKADNVLSLWDWHSKRRYFFTKDDITNVIYHKIKERHMPKNPYTNLEFTFPQLLCIRHFLQPSSSQLDGFLKWGGNMLFLVQIQNTLEHQSTITETLTNTLSVGQRILLEKSYPCFKTKCTPDKQPLFEELVKECCRIICSEDYDVAYVPVTKLQSFLYEAFILGGRKLLIQSVKQWTYHNRRTICLKNSQGQKQDVCE
jgi:hypothetical protein